MKARILSLIFFLFFLSECFGQYDHVSVFPDLDGDQLIEELRSNYRPLSSLDYGEVRDFLFGTVFFKDDSVRCIYTNHARYLAPGEDPSEFIFQNDQMNGINTEHIYPQSKGAEFGNARADMHHLFPARGRVNTARSNDPFAEIPDNETEDWYYKNFSQTNIPSNKDAFSEDTNARFEPRESVKGDVARAMMYFYTMYTSQANSADPDYFDTQIETLCDWHDLDPVDQAEWERTITISGYQDDRPNPFILDCTLAGRTYCESISQACKLVHSADVKLNHNYTLVNPGNGRLHIQFNDMLIKEIEVFNSNGVQVLDTISETRVFDQPFAIPGLFFVRITDENGNVTVSRWFNQI